MTDGQKSLPQDQTSPQLRLNANFVDWLMGWPPGWTTTEVTAYGAEEMALYRSKLQSRLSHFFAAPASSKEAA